MKKAVIFSIILVILLVGSIAAIELPKPPPTPTIPGADNVSENISEDLGDEWERDEEDLVEDEKEPGISTEGVMLILLIIVVIIVLALIIFFISKLISKRKSVKK